MPPPAPPLPAITRRHLQLELKELWQRTGKTVLFITHDIAEALLLATGIVVLSKGPGAKIIARFDRDDIPSDGPADTRYAQAFRNIELAIENQKTAESAQV